MMNDEIDGTEVQFTKYIEEAFYAKNTFQF